jgi:hypothetical protein
MKKILWLLALILAFPLAAHEPAAADVASLQWMTGHWSSEAGGVISEEIWSSPAGGILVGMHRDVKGAKASFEFMRIAQDPEGIVYLAQPGGRSPATPFRLTDSAAHRAVFTNPAHDFPQRITYWRDGEKLCARVEGPMNGKDVNEEWCWAKK